MSELSGGLPQSALPDGWRLVPLKSVILEAQSGFAIGERDSSGVIQLRMNNVDTRGNLNWNEFIRVPATADTISKFRLQGGDVVFNNTNSTELVGKSALFQEREEPVVYSNHFTRLRTEPSLLEPRYLAAWLLSQWHQRVFENLCNRWIGQSAVKADKLLALNIPLPALHEQKRMAAILTEQMAAVEKARAATEAQLQAAKVLPAAYLRDVFESAEAKQWPKKRLGDVLALRKEVVHPRNSPVGAAAFVGLEHIQSGTGMRLGKLDVEMSNLTGRKPKFYQGDIVYGYLRPYLNKLWVAEFDGLCSVDQYVYSVRPEIARTDFVAWFMRSPTYLSRAPIESTPGQLPRIRTEEVASVEIALPSLAEQTRVIGFLTQKLALAMRTSTCLQDQLSHIQRLPSSMLNQAFRNKL